MPVGSFKRVLRWCAPELALSVLKAVFLINGQRIGAGKQSALGLGQMQVDRSGLTTGDQQFPDIVHVSPRLMFRRKLLQRDKRRRQGFRDNPLVVPCDTLFGHVGPASCRFREIPD